MRLRFPIWGTQPKPPHNPTRAILPRIKSLLIAYLLVTLKITLTLLCLHFPISKIETMMELPSKEWGADKWIDWHLPNVYSGNYHTTHSIWR
jgi:hypothetical protein